MVSSIRVHKKFVLVFLLIWILLPVSLMGQNVFRFEHIGTEEGLSQNTGSSILFDSKGFMWIGTMNGLNRYDGYEFKIFRGQSAIARNFTNNRVTHLWEDKKGFIWAETYDGYYHFFNPEGEIFSTIPEYEGNITKNFRMNSFLQYSENIIIIGSSNAGIFILHYDAAKRSYINHQYPDKGSNPLSNNSVRFVFADANKNLWIGTARGVNFLSSDDLKNQNFHFQHQFVNASFTSVCESKKSIWFGTEELGILSYDKSNGKFSNINNKTHPALPPGPVSFLYHTKTGHSIIGSGESVILVNDQDWVRIPFHGKSLEGVYEDRFQQLWLTALEFGTTRLDLNSNESFFYRLTPEKMKHLTDLERPRFFEDHYDNLWIGLHGGGLALYRRTHDQFKFFINDPQDPNSISSNIIHSIAEDNTGQMWIGTGQFLGGIEKVILENPAFRHYLPETDKTEMLDNVVRAIMEDKNRSLWVATKAGRIHIYDSILNKVTVLDSLPGIGNESVRNNTYTIFNDKQGYIWIGSKGDGIALSRQPLGKNTMYGKIRYKRFKHSTDDSTSLGSNNIYSICQDSSSNIWVGTYGNGLSLIKEPHNGNLGFTRINQQNSNLTSNLVRNLLVDRKGNLWVATTMGLNFLSKKDIDLGKYTFKTFLRNPDNAAGLNYNDIVQLYEDVKGRIWLGTFGGGADLLEMESENITRFTHFTSETGLSNDVIFGILEDERGKIWLSTENGLTCLDPELQNATIYNTYNGLNFNNFSENTCFKRKDHSLCFGGYLGFEVIHPGMLVPEAVKPRIELTGFMLFNKEVPVNQSGSPLSKNISFTNGITLRYNQSSFSINFSALDFLDPAKVNYVYKLDNFEQEWNNVGNQNRATYTNLSPGKYIFRVKALKSNDPEGSVERILYIHIRPPWWKTIPALIAYLIVLGFVSVSIYKTAARLSRYRNELLVEKKVNELKLQFFTNISHEIRTPLTLIISPIEDILATHGISSRNRTLMAIIHKNAKRMLDLTSQLLDFRKIQNNKMILKIREIELVAFARDIYESFIPLARHKSIRYTFNSAIDSVIIFADPTKLDTIIYNIISNAIKFTPQNKTVSVKIKSADDHFIDIAISDEGPGIPEKNLSDIFTRYTILSNNDFAGTGIGLSLSYELAKLHDGDILISSVEGLGSTFTVRMPIGIPAEENAETRQPLFDRKSISRDQERETAEVSYDHHDDIVNESSKYQVVLIVEDNQEIMDYISQSLRATYNCIGAKNGEEGLHIARSINPDLIITDIMMPVMDGLDMTRILKEDFNTCHIPVVMLTSKVDLTDQIAGIETGAEAYILKPFNLEYLKAVTGNLLSQRSKIVARFTGNKEITVDQINVATRDEVFLKKTISYIEENYENDFQVDSLAEHCCVGRTVFYNKIKGLTGLAPLELVRKVKLKIASQLLEKGYNVSEVAYKIGFSDVKYFSRQYKAQFGHPPSKQNSKA